MLLTLKCCIIVWYECVEKVAKCIVRILSGYKKAGAAKTHDIVPVIAIIATTTTMTATTFYIFAQTGTHGLS